VRGDVFELRAPRRTSGHEQRGPRYAVVIQSDDLHLSTLIIAPTSTTARPTVFRPSLDILGRRARVLVEQAMAADPARLGRWVGRVTPHELAEIEDALRLVLALD